MLTHEQEEVGGEFSFKKLFVPLTTLKAIHWIIIIGLIVYANMLFNAFIFDDDAQIIENYSVHSITSIPDTFLNNIHAAQDNDYYRPLPTVVYTLLYHFFGANSFPYHSLQLLFHITNTILIFLIFKRYIKQGLAFFLALIFLVHPINEEAVVYIADLQDVLFVFFGLLSLYVLQSKTVKLKNLILVNIFLFLSLLSKESGILFFGITFIYICFFHKKNLLSFTLLSFATGIIYVLIRFFVHASLQKDALVPIMTLSLGQRMLHIPAIIFYYIQTFLFPYHLVFLHTWVIHIINFSNFFLPLLFDFVFLGILLFMAFIINQRKQSKKAVLFSFSWFVVGLLLYLQIFPLDVTVADRFFYFPIIGLLFVIGLFLQSIPLNKNLQTVYLYTGILLLIVLSVRTVIRNTNWVNQTTLLTHDEQLSHTDYEQELLYSVDLFWQNKTDDSLIHAQKALILYPRSWIGWNTLGAIYYKKGNVSAAKKAYLHSIAIDDRYYQTYENMAILLYNYDSHKKTRDFTRKATQLFPYSSQLWFYRAITEYELGDYNNALFSAKNYYLLKQDSKSYEFYYLIQKKLPLPLTK